MKKISNEVKVGAVALITILVFIWVYNFLKGKDLFSSTSNYYAVYKGIGGLAESSPVEVNGFKVGVVQSIKFLKTGSDELLVELSVDKGLKLPVSTVAEITAVSLIAGMKVQLIYGNGPGFYSKGDTLAGRLAESLVTRLETELTPLRERITDLVVVLDSVISSFNQIMDPQFKINIKKGVASLSNTAQAVEEAGLKSSLENINKFTAMIAANTENFNNTFDNLKAVSDTLAAADIYGSVISLKASLEKTALLLENLNKGKGTAGQLMTNDSLYSNLSGSLKNLKLLLEDLKANPKRYVHFSLFGKKNIPAK